MIKYIMGVAALIVFFFVWMGIYHLIGGWIYTTIYFIGLMAILVILNKEQNR